MTTKSKPKATVIPKPKISKITTIQKKEKEIITMTTVKKTDKLHDLAKEIGNEAIEGTKDAGACATAQAITEQVRRAFGDRYPSRFADMPIVRRLEPVIVCSAVVIASEFIPHLPKPAVIKSIALRGVRGKVRDLIEPYLTEITAAAYGILGMAHVEDSTEKTES